MSRILAVIALLVLAGCATIPAGSGFSAAQVAALTGAGFAPVGENYELGVEERLLFEFDRSELTPQPNPVLGRVAGALVRVGIRGAAVVGHTDSSGTRAYNLALSQRRAASVRDGLVVAGMDAARIRASGVGERLPIASNATAQGRAENRRVVIIISPEDAR